MLWMVQEDATMATTLRQGVPMAMLVFAGALAMLPAVVDGADVRRVPTFVVIRDGREVGRIVESSPRGVESDLGALLRGECRGVVSSRTDVGAVSCGSPNLAPRAPP
jgi:hypothetical protein